MKKEIEKLLVENAIPLYVVGNKNDISVYWKQPSADFYITQKNEYIDIADFLDGYSLTHQEETEIYSSLGDIVKRIYEIRFNSYQKQQEIKDDKAFMLIMKTSAEKTMSLDMEVVKSVNGKKSFLELSYQYFSQNNISKDDITFELNVYANKVAAKSRRSIANTLVANKTFYETYNVKEIMPSRWNICRFIIDKDIPNDTVIIHIGTNDNTSSVYDTTFIIESDKYVVHPNASVYGFVLNIGDISDHFIKN